MVFISKNPYNILLPDNELSFSNNDKTDVSVYNGT